VVVGDVEVLVRVVRQVAVVVVGIAAAARAGIEAVGGGRAGGGFRYRAQAVGSAGVLKRQLIRIAIIEAAGPTGGFIQPATINVANISPVVGVDHSLVKPIRIARATRTGDVERIGSRQAVEEVVLEVVAHTLPAPHLPYGLADVAVLFDRSGGAGVPLVVPQSQ